MLVIFILFTSTFLPFTCFYIPRLLGGFIFLHFSFVVAQSWQHDKWLREVPSIRCGCSHLWKNSMEAWKIGADNFMIIAGKWLHWQFRLTEKYLNALVGCLNNAIRNDIHLKVLAKTLMCDIMLRNGNQFVH